MTQELPIKKPEGDPGKPFFSFDFDGVICRPPFGQNRVLGRNLYSDELPTEVRRVDRTRTSFQGKTYIRLRSTLEALKYFGRDPMPNAKEGIEEIAKHRNLVIITGRSYLAQKIVEAWLKRYGMSQHFKGIYANNTELRTRKFKLYLLRQFGITEHADDDGAITYYLAGRGIGQLYLRKWTRNRGLPYQPNVFEFTDIIEVAQHIQSLDAAALREREAKQAVIAQTETVADVAKLEAEAEELEPPATQEIIG